MVSKLTLGSLALLTSSTSVLAQTILTPFQNQTGPFFLRVTSADNETYDGSFLVACRTGNLVQGLCLGPDTVNNHTWHFFWNYTTVNDEPSKIGLLTWTLPILSNNALSISESMVLNFQPGSNVALPMFMVSFFSPFFSRFDMLSMQHVGADLSRSLVLARPRYPSGLGQRHALRPQPLRRYQVHA